jgi:hypothetical protein
VIFPYLDPSSQALALGAWVNNSTASSSAEIFFTPVANNHSWVNVSGGNFGIGTTAPATKLDVVGAGLFGNHTGSLTAGTYSLGINERTTVTTGTIYGVLAELEANPSGASDGIYHAGYFPAEIISGNAQNITGRLVGIQGQVNHSGTGTLTQARGVAGIINNQSTGTIATGYGGYYLISNVTGGTIQNAHGVFVDTGASNGTNTSRSGVTINADTAASNNTLLLMGTSTIPTGDFALYSSSTANSYFAGDVGIGTAAPGATLNVYDNTSGDYAVEILQDHADGYGLLIDVDGNLVSEPALRITSDGTTATTNYFYVGSNGNVGIGTGTPAQKLDIMFATDQPHISFGDDVGSDRVSIRATATGIGNSAEFRIQASEGQIKLGGNSQDYALSIQDSGNSDSFLFDAANTQFDMLYDSNDYTRFTVGSDATLTIDVVASAGDTSENVYFGAGIFPGETSTRATQTNKFIVADNTNDAILTNASSWGTGGTDFAEVFDVEGNLEYGDLVQIYQGSTIDYNQPKVIKSSSSYSGKMIGVVSDRPGFVGGRKEGDGYVRNRTIGLLGRVPLKVSTINGPISLGDPLTSSDIVGVAAKASREGPVIARALENFSCDSNPCQGKILAFVQYGWYNPQLEINNEGIVVTPKDKLQDEQIAQNSDKTGTLTEKFNQLESSLSPLLEAMSNSATTSAKLTTDQLTALIALIKSQTIQTGNILSENITSLLGNIESLIADRIFVNKLISTGVIETEKLSTLDLEAAGTAKISQLETGSLKPDNATGQIEVDLSGSSVSGAMVFRSQGDKIVASIDGSGNAVFEGSIEVGDQIVADSLLTSKDATVSGTLFADDIQSKDLDQIQSSFGELSSQFNNLQNNVSTLSGHTVVNYILPTETPSPSPTFIPIATLAPLVSPTPEILPIISSDSTESAYLQDTDVSSLIIRLRQFLDNSSSLQAKTDEFISSSSALIADGSVGYNPDNLIGVNSSIPASIENLNLQTLKVISSTSLADTSIAGQLLVDSNIVVESNKIQSLSDTLYLTAQKAVDILGGKVIVDVTGNLTVEGTLYAKGGIQTNQINPPPNQDITININSNENSEERIGGFGKLLVKGENQTEVVSIDQQGTATFSGSLNIAKDTVVEGSLTSQKLNIEKPSDSTSSSFFLTAGEHFVQTGINAPAMNTQGTAGDAYIPIGTKEIVIYNQNITDNTLIYITPTSSTSNRTLFVADKQSGSHFIVALDNETVNEVKFNWWIIN